MGSDLLPEQSRSGLSEITRIYDQPAVVLCSSQSEMEFFRLMDYEIRRGAQFLALCEGQFVLKTRLAPAADGV